MSIALTWNSERRFGGFAVWTPHFVFAKADALAGLFYPEAVFLASSEVLAQKIPVFAVGESPAGGASVHGRFPSVETSVFVAVFIVVVVAIAAFRRFVREVFGKPVVVSDFDNPISVTVTRVLELVF